MNSPQNNLRFASSIATIFAVALGCGLGFVGTVDAQIPVPVGSGSAIVSVFVPHG
jgi:hypothetical protein